MDDQPDADLVPSCKVLRGRLARNYMEARELRTLLRLAIRRAEQAQRDAETEKSDPKGGA